nr:hypothetical protein [Tanacetum cinerariifolium]
MKKTQILTRRYGVTPTIVLRRNLFKARHVTHQDYGVTTRKVYAVTLLLWKDETSESALRHHGFVGYPFDYRVTLGFDKIAGGLDHVNPVIRLPLEHGINREPSVVKPEIRDNVNFEIESQFMRELREDTFFENKNEDAHDHVDRVLNIGTSSRNISSSSDIDGLATVISKLDNLGRDMKKLKENVYAIQAGCQFYKGPHLEKECPLKEEVKQVDEVKYGKFRESKENEILRTVLNKLHDEWFKRTDEDDDDLEGIIDYIEPTLYEGFVDSDDEEYKERKCRLLGMPYIKPPLILIEKFNVTRYSIGPREVYIKINVSKVEELSRTKGDIATISAGIVDEISRNDDNEESYDEM